MCKTIFFAIIIGILYLGLLNVSMVSSNCILIAQYIEKGEFYSNETIRKQRIIVSYTNPKSTTPNKLHYVVLLGVNSMCDRFNLLTIGETYKFECYPVGTKKGELYYTDLKTIRVTDLEDA